MKKTIIALILGIMIGSAGTAFASLEGEVTAVFAQFKMMINGQEKQLETTPLVYNGTSYLPVREMANLVGYDVTYKADSRTIELEDSRKGVANLTNALNVDEWVTLRDLSEKYGIQVKSSGLGNEMIFKVLKDNITYFEFNTKELGVDKEVTFKGIDGKTFRMANFNDILYVNKGDLTSFGFSDQ